MHPLLLCMHQACMCYTFLYTCYCNPLYQFDKNFDKLSTILTTMAESTRGCSLSLSVSGVGAKSATVGIQASFEVHGSDLGDREAAVLVECLSCELTHVKSGQCVPCSVRKAKKWMFSKKHCVISYTPTLFGKHRLEIRYQGNMIPDSPFCVYVLRNYDQPKLVISNVPQPMDLTLTDNSELVVVHSGKNYLTVYSQRNDELKKVETKFSFLRGCTRDPSNGTLLVTCSSAPYVFRISMDGNTLKEFTELDKHKFDSPTGIALHPVTHKIYIANGLYEIVVLNSDLSFNFSFGEYGEEPGQLWSPRSIAFNSLGHVFIADHTNLRVAIFSADGNHLGQFGKSGWAVGELMTTKSVSIDCDDLVYVCEGGNHPRLRNHRISIFTSNGEFLKLFGSFGSSVGQFSEPHSAIVDEDRTVYVCDTMNNRIQIF